MTDNLDAFWRAHNEIVEPGGGSIAGADFVLETAIRSWIAFVATIEVGYDDEWEEYAMLELATRDYLDDLTRLLPGRWADYIAARVAPWDERFKRATREADKPHLPPLSGPVPWWRLRTPINWQGRSYEPDDP
jgi:hypothetical protein